MAESQNWVAERQKILYVPSKWQKKGNSSIFFAAFGAMFFRHFGPWALFSFVRLIFSHFRLSVLTHSMSGRSTRNHCLLSLGLPTEKYIVEWLCWKLLLPFPQHICLMYLCETYNFHFQVTNHQKELPEVAYLSKVAASVSEKKALSRNHL